MVVSFPPHTILLHAPKMRVSILLSNTLNDLSLVFDSVHVSDAYVSTGLTSTLYINVLIFLDIKCDFRYFLSPWKIWNVVVDWLKLLLHIPEVPGSKLGPETGYPG
jgi:hypothetical protein